MLDSKIVAKIYDLRSRLGMIVLLNQKINSQKEVINKMIEDDKYNIISYSYDIKEDLRSYEKTQKDIYWDKISKEIKVSDDQLNEIYRKERCTEIKIWKKNRNKKLLIAIPSTLVLIIISLFVFLVNITVYFDLDVYDSLSSSLSSFVRTVLSILLVIVLIQMIVSTIIKLDFSRKQVAFDKYSQARKEAEKEIRAKYYAKMDNINKEQSYKDIENEVNIKIDSHKNQITIKEQKSLKNIKELIETKENISIQTHKQYDNFINPADYKNLDLILYLIETDRVESIKEALLEIDKREYQKQMLDTLSEGFQQIQKSINMGLTRIEKTMNNKLSSIEERVNYFGNSIENIGFRMNLMESNYEVMHRERIDAIEGLKFSAAIDSYELSKLVEKASSNVTDELKYISRQIMR